MEKIVKPMSGFFALLLGIILLIVAGYFFAQTGEPGTGRSITIAIFSLLTGFFLLLGIIIVPPNYSQRTYFFW